jgi:hypothetical protein
MRVLHAGSAAVALALSAACATHTTAGPDPVKTTTVLADVAGCDLLGKIIVSDTEPDAAKAARDQTAAIGGNVLLRKNELVWNGNAYHCPGMAH